MIEFDDCIGSLVSDATALPTEPQPLPAIFIVPKVFKIQSFSRRLKNSKRMAQWRLKIEQLR